MNANAELHVIFGTGPLGAWTARNLLAMGKTVRMVNRSGKAADLPAAIDIVKGDAYDREFTRTVSAGAAVVYQCAQPPYHQWPEQFPALQAAILDGAAANGAKLIVGDNLYMYGDTGGAPIHEELPYAARTRKGRTRARMAEAVLEAHASGKVRAAIGRASDFFGPDDHNYGRLWFVPALHGKAMAMLGRLDMPHTFSYVADFGKALAILGTRDEALGQAWHIPSPPPVTQAELVALVAEELGRPVKTMMGNTLLLRLMGLFNPLMREMVEMMYEWTQPFVMDSGKFERTFALSPTPLRTMVRETIAWARLHEPQLVAAQA